MDSVRMHVLLAVACAGDRRRLVEYLRESESLHLTVETVGSLARCLEVLGEGQFDAVILDTGLPDAASEADAVGCLVTSTAPVPAIVLASTAGTPDLAATFSGRGTVEIIARDEITFGVLSPALLRVTAAAGRATQCAAPVVVNGVADGDSILASGIAHDFNNLLCVIAANVEMARSSGGDWLDEALETIGEARSLARQLLHVRDARTSEMEHLDPAELLRGTLRVLRAAFGPAIATTLRLEGGAPDVLGDRIQLSRVLTNLLLNARDAVLERRDDAGSEHYLPEIVLALRTRIDAGHGWVDLVIEDNGPGISREKVVRIFEPFFTTKGARGTGLGLATCRRIVAEHGGELTVTTREGEGTRFVVSLPAALEPLPRRAPRLSPVAASGGPTVLIVDDDHRVVRVLALALEREGYRVLTATTAADALRLAESGPIDTILLDLWMPGTNGWQTLTQLRASGIDAPTILMSGAPLEDDVRSSQVTATLAKPFGITEMLDAVARATAEASTTPVAIAS